MARRDDDDEYTYSRPKSGKRLIKTIVGLVVAVLVLGAAAVVVDMGMREFVEARAKDEVAKRLPSGSSDVAVQVQGFSFLTQLAGGELDDVDVRFALSEGGITQLAATAGMSGQIRLSDSTMIVESQTELAGIVVPFSIALKPSIDGGYLVLTATSIELRENEDGVLPNLGGVDISSLVDVATIGIHSCVASALPASISLTSVIVDGDKLRVTAEGKGVPTDLDALTVKGSCSPLPPASGEQPEGEQPAA